MLATSGPASVLLNATTPLWWSGVQSVSTACKSKGVRRPNWSGLSRQSSTNSLLPYVPGPEGFATGVHDQRSRHVLGTVKPESIGEKYVPENDQTVTQAGLGIGVAICTV